MPNWCDNDLTIVANKETIDKIVDLVFNEKGEFDFAKIVPPPDHPDYNNEPLDTSKELWNSPYNWYVWNISNWGTKWNASGTVKHIKSNGQRLDIFFWTAWAPSIPVTEALKELFPNAKYTHTYLDEFDNEKETIEI